MAGFPSDPQLTPTELTDPTTKIPAATGAGGAERRSVTPQQIISSANVGSATDTPDASGSLWARFLALMQDIGNYTAAPDQSGTIKQRIRWLIDAVGNRVTVSTYNGLRNAVGLASNNANIFGTTIWGRLNQVTLWLGNVTSATFYYYQNFTATSLSSEAATARTIWVWLKRFSDSIKNLGDRLVAVVNDINAIKGTGYQSSTTLASLQQDVDNAGGGGGTTDQATLNRITALEGSVGESSDYNTGSGSLTGNIFERLRWLYEAVSARVTQATFNTLSNLVGGRPSLTYYYFATATASALSSANANTQAVWTWLSRLFTSIRNLDNKIALLKGVGYQSTTTLASLQQAVSSGGGGGGTPGANGLPGRQMGVFFRESATEPADPVVGEDTSGSYVKVATPSGWSTTRPANPTQKLWMLVQQGQGNVANDAFTETFSSGPIDISPGADGANGLAGRVWRFFFRRSATAIAAPSVTPYVTAGRVDIQTPSGWSTSIPAGTETLRMLAQSTQPNAANNGGHHSLSFIIPLPQPAAGGGGGGISQQTFNELANAVGASSDAEDIDGTTLWNQFNQVKEWLGSPSGNLSYYADQNTTSISSAQAASQAIWVWLTRFSFSIRNLKNRLGASTDTDDIDGNGVWARVNQIKTWLGNRPTSIFYFFPTPNSSTLATGHASAQAIWTWVERAFDSIQNLYSKHLSQAASITTLQTQIGAIDTGTASDRPAQYTEKIYIQDKDTTLPNESGVETALADLGYQENDLVRNPVPKLFRVRGSHLPLDHPMRVTSTDTDIAISNSYHLYGWAKAVIPELTNATSGTIAEVDNAATQDIGDQLVAILNMSSLSTIDGKFIIVMSRPSASNDGFVPDELTIKIGDSPMRVFANVDEYHRTTTHIFYQTSQVFESGLGVNPLFGDSQVGQAVNFDVGIKNAEGNNFLLSAATTLYLQEILIDRVSTAGFGKLADIPRAQDKALGSRYDTEEGETYIVKEKVGREKFIIPILAGNGVYGKTNKTDGALSGKISKVNFDPQGTFEDVNELSYDYTNEYWRVVLEPVTTKIATQLKVWKDGWGDVKSADADIMKLIVPPESITHGTKLKLAGTIIPRSNAAKITAANFGANITRDGNSVNRYVGAQGSNGTFPSGANLEGWFFDRQEDWLQADVERSNHTQMKNWIVGQKLTPQVTGQVVHYREQQTNEGNLGSRNANHQIGLYEMKLSFGSSDRDDTYLHLPIANADVASNQKLVVFLHRKNASNSNPDFIDMEHRDGFMFDLEYSRAISDVAYPRYKWRIAANQNLEASLEALAGDWYVGVAIMTTATIATDVHDLVESWIPKAYTKLYFEGVQLPVENLVISRNSDDDFIFSYRSGGYSQTQREKMYPSNAAENTKDIMVSGQQYVINLINVDGGTHIRMLADMAQHIKEFDHFKVDVLGANNTSIFVGGTQKYWQRLPKAGGGEIVHRGLNARAPLPHHLNQRAIFTTGEGGSFRPYESVAMYNRFDTAPYLRVVLPLTNPSGDSVWTATPEMWRDCVPNLPGILGVWAGLLMRIDIPTVANSRVLLYVLSDDTVPAAGEMDRLDMRGREWNDITLDPIADFRRDARRLAHDDANNRSYFCYVIDHSTFNAVNVFDPAVTFHSFILWTHDVTTSTIYYDDVKPRKVLEYVHVR